MFDTLLSLLWKVIMKYEDFTYIDFIKDDFFANWVLKPNYESDLFWKKWMANHPHKIQEIDKAKKFIQKISYEKNYSLSEKDFDRVHENLIRFQSEYKYKSTKTKRSSNSFYWYAAAAVLLIGLFTFISTNFIIDEQPTYGPEVVTYKTTKTIRGMKHTFQLPDGTLVKLNSESSLQYPESFTSDNRVVYLEGEAYFEVENNPDKPFIIYSSGFKTEVKGTSFNIHAYEDDIKKVSVVSGLVAVSLPDKDASFVYTKQMAVLDSKANKFQITKYDPLNEIGWKDNILHFEDVKLKQVFERLERWYGVDIIVNNKTILNDIYQGEYKNESLDNVLTGIGYTSEFQFTIENKKVYIN